MRRIAILIVSMLLFTVISVVRVLSEMASDHLPTIVYLNN